MSIVRKSSRATLRPTAEDFSAAMDQKNSLIIGLQTEIEALRPRQEEVNRADEDLRRSKARYECLLREQVSFPLLRKHA